MPPTVTTAMDAAIDVADEVIEEALVAVDEPAALQETTLDDAVALEVAAELAEGLQDAAALDADGAVGVMLGDTTSARLPRSADSCGYDRRAGSGGNDDVVTR